MHDLSMPAPLAEWLARLPSERFARRESLLEPGGALHGFYLRDGLVRRYSLAEDGSEFIHDFLGGHEWAFGSLQVAGGAVCCGGQAIGVDAVTDVVAARVKIADLDRWRQGHPEVSTWLFDLLVRLAAGRFEREADLALRSAEDRYVRLLRQHPALLTEVPLRQVAAWLGITPVALSRIRRRLQADGDR